MALLKTLHINFRMGLRGLVTNCRNDHILARPLRMPNLCDLALVGLSARQEELHNFLEAHAGTLRRLRLAQFNIQDTEVHVIGLPEYGSWVGTIKKMSICLKLSEVKLDGYLKSGKDNWRVLNHESELVWIPQMNKSLWVGPYPSPDMKLSPTSLQGRIIDFILHGGNCPLSLADYPDCSLANTTWKAT